MRPSKSSWLLALPLLTAPAIAQGPIDDAGQQGTQEAGAELTPAQQVKAIQDEFQAAYGAFLEAYRAAEDDQARSKVVEELYPDAGEFAKRLWPIADANVGTDAALDALVWIGSRAQQDLKRVLDAVVAHHIESPKIATLVQGIYIQDEPTRDAVEAILAGSPHKDVQGKACFVLARYWKGNADAGNKDALAKAEELYEVLISEYPDVASYRGTMKEAAEHALFEIRNLAIGMTAPDITGEDLDGVAFKVSDYRGKVVVLDFWGDW